MKAGVSKERYHETEALHVNATAADRESRLRRSLRRLGYDLAEAGRGRWYVRKEGSKANVSAGMDLAGVEAWIREKVKV